MDITTFNADWLRAWSDKDTERLLTFYHPQVTYRDGQVPAGIEGRAALRTYLDGLFGAKPPMHYEPDQLWPIENGYCGRWICTMTLPAGASYLRGFDLVILRDGLIALNEVYTHALSSKP